MCLSGAGLPTAPALCIRLFSPSASRLHCDILDGNELPLQQNFEYEEVKGMIDTSIEPILGNQVYAPKKVGDWTSAIVESVLKLLQAANKPFKYVVTCIIMQKNGAGLHTASTCFWDTKSDGEAHACAEHLKSSDCIISSQHWIGSPNKRNSPDALLVLL